MTTASTRNYQDGYCNHLAAAIWEISGYVTDWRIAIFDGAGSHVVAVTPDGRYLDSLGIRSREEICGTWYETETIVADTRSLYAEGWDTPLDADDYRAALVLLEREGLADDDVREIAASRIEDLED
jgi:hypothetical protein